MFAQNSVSQVITDFFPSTFPGSRYFEQTFALFSSKDILESGIWSWKTRPNPAYYAYRANVLSPRGATAQTHYFSTK